MTVKRTRPASVSRRLSERDRQSNASEPVSDAGTVFKQFFDRLAEAAGSFSPNQAGSVHHEGSLPFNLAGREGRAVFGYTVRMGLDGLQAERFGDAPTAREKRSPLGATTRSAPAARVPIVDVFNEGDSLRVVAELPGASIQDVTFELAGNTLRIATTTAPHYQKTVEPPAQVDRNSLEHSCHNGILEVRLRRADAP